MLIRGAVAVFALVIIAAVILPKVIGAGNGNPRFSSVRSIISTHQSMLDHFHQDCGRFPTAEEGLSALHSPPADLKDKWGPQPYTDLKKFNDPWGTPYLYWSENPDEYVMGSLGADRKPGGRGFDQDVIAVVRSTGNVDRDH
jgi:general secretion pathway protein G